MLDRFLRPAQIKTNQDGALLRLIAASACSSTTQAKCFFPQLTWMRLVGRLAFPLFAYGIAVGAADDQTSTTVYHPRGGAGAGQSAALRRGSGAHEQRDVCRPVCAAPASRALYLLYKELGNAQHSAAAASGAFAAAVHPRKEVHSGAADLRALRAFFRQSGLRRGRHSADDSVYLFLEYPALCFAVTTAYMLAWALDGRGYPIFGVQFGMRLFAVPAVMLASLPIRRKTQLPKWLTYGFYPAHLIILLILEKIF